MVTGLRGVGAIAARMAGEEEVRRRRSVTGDGARGRRHLWADMEEVAGTGVVVEEEGTEVVLVGIEGRTRETAGVLPLRFMRLRPSFRVSRANL